MTELHLPTLFVAMLMLAATLTLVVGTLAWRSREDGLPQLTASLALHGLTYGAVGLRGRLDDAALLALGNVALTAAYALVNEAICRFQRRAPPRALLWAPPLAVLALQFWLYGRTTERVLVLAILIAAQCLTALHLLLQRRRETVGVGHYLLAGNFVAIVAVLAYRAVAVALAGPMAPMSEGMRQLQGVSFVLGSMTMVVLAMAFVIMTREAADERNRVLAMRDELTGLGNRRTLLDALTQQSEQARRSGLPLSVLVVDIDRFKSVNDVYGHLSGDVAINGVAQVMQSSLRGQDVLGRMGGEEFLAILPATPRDGAQVVAERLRGAVEAARFAAVDGRQMRITVSVGLHEFDPRAELGIEAVIRAADEALYRAKAQGRNRVVMA